MRSWVQRACVLASVGVLVGLVASRPAPATGEDPTPTSAKFEASSALYGAAELGLGGRPLWQALFPSGWPTTKEYRRITLEDGEAAFVDNIAAMLGSGLGVPLTVSSAERARLDEVQKSEPKLTTVTAMLRDRFEQFRQLTGLADPIDDKFMPVFLPFWRGDPIVGDAYNESRPGSWAWSSKNTDSTVVLGSIGLAIYAQTLLAEQQLSLERRVDNGSGAQVFVGRSDVEGFVALCALDCAVAAMHEVRLKLCMNLKLPEKPKLESFPKDYNTVGEFYRRTYFPNIVTPQVQVATVNYDVGTSKEAKKSYLFDQACLLLGVCELARASDKTTGAGRFFLNDKKPAFFDPATSSQAAELAAFIVESLYAIHSNPQGKLSSFADITSSGELLRTQDAGAILLALESFVQLNTQKPIGGDSAQKHARNMIERVAAFLVTVQKTSKVSPGFCDAFNLQSDSPTEEDKASLAAQGFAIRGLLAAKRAFALPAFGAGNAARPQVLAAAEKTVEFLEKARWDADRRAYVDAPGTKDKVKLRAFDAFAVLGGLRDLALDKRDIRCLLRYKTYLATLRRAGLQLSGSSREGDGSDGVKRTAAVGLAPVTASEVTLP